MAIPLSIFVSHSSKDTEWVRELGLRMRSSKSGVTYWVDVEDIRVGDVWTIRVEDALFRADGALLLVSKAFLASEPIITKELPTIGSMFRDGFPVICVPIAGCSHNRLAKHLQLES